MALDVHTRRRSCVSGLQVHDGLRLGFIQQRGNIEVKTVLGLLGFRDVDEVKEGPGPRGRPQS